MSASGASDTPGRRELLGKIGKLSDDKVSQIVHLLEPLPQTAETRLLLDQLRPAMRRLRPPRPLRLQRQWCRVFEDLLTSEEVAPEGPLIARSAIGPTWRLVVERSGGLVGELEAKLKTVTGGQPGLVREITGQLWSRSAAILAEAIDGGVSLPHLALIGDTVAAADAIEAFKDNLPQKPIESLGTSESAAIESGLRTVVQKGVRADGYMLAIAARLRNPSDLLALQARLDAGFSANVMRLLSALTVASLEERARSFDRMAVEAPAGQVAREAEQLLKSLASAEEGGDEAARKQAKQRMAAATVAVRDALQARIIEPASALIDVALPGGAEPATREALIAAEDHAQALGRSRPVAKLAGLEKQSTETVQQISRRFEEKIDELLNRSEADGDEAGIAEKDIYRSIRIIELVEGPARAQKLLLEARRRLKASLQAKG